MKKSEVIRIIKKYEWEKWLERPFNPFILSLFAGGNSKNFFKKIGIFDVECKAFLYENSVWYESKEIWDEMAKQLEIFLRKGSIFEITKSLSKYRRAGKKEINNLIIDKKLSNSQKLKRVKEILTPVTTYIWLAHGLEYYYASKLNAVVPLYVKKDIDLFIGDASFPKKKNSHAFFEEAIARGEDPKKIAEKYGWLRSRDGFEDPFTPKEIQSYKLKKIKSAKK